MAFGFGAKQGKSGKPAGGKPTKAAGKPFGKGAKMSKGR